MNTPKTKKLRADLDVQDTKKFEIIKKWLGVKSDAEVVRFMINQIYNALKEGKLSVLKD